ncbi:MAG: aspartate kinase, partial [Synechocystis sp.]|nr:aspartate kinase [Synechocystis sp.]
VGLAQQISPNPCRREMDMLLSTGEQVSIALLSLALQEIAQPAISLTGAQVGIVTEAEHSRARILEIRPDRLEQHLREGKVVVVAGFQGISSVEHLEITTLGRGGSDTSAVALAAALKADCCEIYTDVPGILTTDPRLVPDAQLMPEITCDEMLELASLGAKVLHPRAVEIARNYGITLVVRSSWSDEPGTKVVAPPVKDRSLVGLEIAKAVDGVEYDADQAKVALLRVPDRPGVAAKLFRDISQQQVDIDLIIQSIHDGNSNDIAFTVVKNLLTKAEAVTAAIAPSLRSSPEADQEAEIIVEHGIAKIAIAGAGMIGRPGIAAKMFKTLADAGVNIEMISTSEVKVSCVIDHRDADRAINALSTAFGIGLSPAKSQVDTNPLPAVRGVALDQDQAQIAIRHVPDRPGMAAQLFMALAEANISVDMIIQSQRCRINAGKPCRDIAFMVAEGDSEPARQILLPFTHDWVNASVEVNKAIAKVSIVGSGMIGQPGVAAHFFAALAQEQINIEMIATSEIKISCVVPQDRGIDALRAAHSAFGLAGQTTVTVPA